MSTQRFVAEELRALLYDGLAQGLFSGAAAAVSTPRGRSVAFAGTLAHDDPTPVGPHSLFDLASVTKTFTAAVTVRLAESRVVDLDASVGHLLPPGPETDGVTLRRLLTHTSGFPAESFVWRDPGIPAGERLARVLSTPLESPPGATHRYSCLGYIAAGAIVERLTGTPLPDLLAELLRDPLGLTSLAYGPVDAAATAATEDESWVGRGMVRGEVHDELAWFLGGRVGNAGLFATASDVLGFVESLLDDRLFGADARADLTTDALAPPQNAPYGQALGARIGDPDIADDPTALGHPGFTGTMWVAFPERRTAAVLLTNRVHPRRDLVDLGPFRRRFSAWASSTADRLES